MLEAWRLLTPTSYGFQKIGSRSSRWLSTTRSLRPACYGAASERSSGAGMPMTSAEDALSEDWLARTDQTLDFYKHLRDEFEPGKPMW